MVLIRLASIHSWVGGLCECVAGWLLWGGNRTGAVLALGLLPFEGVFWWGFSLPYGPPLGLVRTALILASWKSLV